jgi:hypothetical protein
VGALAAAIDGEVGADTTVCEAAQGSANIEERASKTALRFIKLLIGFPSLSFQPVWWMGGGHYQVKAETGMGFCNGRELIFCRKVSLDGRIDAHVSVFQAVKGNADIGDKNHMPRLAGVFMLVS